MEVRGRGQWLWRVGGGGTWHMEVKGVWAHGLWK